DPIHPIDQVGFLWAGSGIGQQSAAVTPSKANTQGLAYFIQYTGGTLGNGYNSGSGWSYGATVNVAGNAIAFEAQQRNALTSDTTTPITASEPWSGGSNGPQASAILLIDPVAAASPTPSPSPSPSPSPTPSPTPTPLPSTSVAPHVQTWLYYGLNGINSTIPASYMASKATFVETDAAEGTVAQNFKNAGGKYAVNYSDPTLVPYCNPPFTQPAGACNGPIGNLGLPEAAYLHAPDTTRLYRYSYSTYQEILNPGSAQAQAGYNTLTAQKLGQIPSLDFFFADDSGGPYDGSDGTPASGLLWNFDQHHSLEFADGADSAWIAARGAMLASALRPVFVNGRDPYSWLPSYGGAYLRLANVVGQNNEGCFTADDYGVEADQYNRWKNMANSLLAITGMQRYAVCMMMGTVTPANRLYGYASWLITYDPVYSLAGQVNAGPDGYAVFPEFDIVPTTPKATATSDVSVLRSGGGAYVREFGQCYQNGSPIGPCAAVVNTTGGTIAMPALSGTYAHTLNLDSNGSYTGGRAWWSTGVPSSLKATTAAIVAR
ncbi:MAG: hypothetical protein JO359_14510, partial [Candidatus Eremiobacteraeota bacterium]|nr:hypothetical protein [Candidatus Eremiobacteraeota bacterium]